MRSNAKVSAASCGELPAEFTLQAVDDDPEVAFGAQFQPTRMGVEIEAWPQCTSAAARHCRWSATCSKGNSATPASPSSLVYPAEVRMTMVVVGVGLIALGVAAWMLARASMRVRTVAEVLYETERSGDPFTK